MATVPAGDLLVGIDDRPPIGRAALWGLQHVLAMFAGMVAVPLAVGSAIGLSGPQMTILVQGAMVASGIATIVQSLGFGPLGARLPIVMGTAFVFIPPMISIGERFDIPTIMGALIVGGVVEGIIAFFIWRVRRFFPPLVTGTVVTLIGLGLVPLAFFWSAGGERAFGEARSFLVALVVLAVLVVVNQWGRRFVGSLAIVIAIVVGYVASGIAGLLDLSPVANASWVEPPELFAFGVPKFHVGAIVGILFAQLASMLETVGDTYAIGGATGKKIEASDLRGAIAVDGFASAVAPVVNGFSVTSFSQNIGVISLTGVGSRFVVAVGGGLLLVLALIPKFATVIALMPEPVLGGAALAMFGAITAAGVNTLREIELTQREVLIFGISVALGLGVATAPDGTFAAFPSVLRSIVESSVAIGGITAIVLDQTLPRRTRTTTEDV